MQLIKKKSPLSIALCSPFNFKIRCTWYMNAADRLNSLSALVGMPFSNYETTSISFSCLLYFFVMLDYSNFYDKSIHEDKTLYKIHSSTLAACCVSYFSIHLIALWRLSVCISIRHQKCKSEVNRHSHMSNCGIWMCQYFCPWKTSMFYQWRNSLLFENLNSTLLLICYFFNILLTGK